MKLSSNAILSLVCTPYGCTFAKVTPDAVTILKSLSFKSTRFMSLLALPTSVMEETIRELILFAGEQPLDAIVITCPEETAILRDRRGRCVTPILFGLPLTLPKREIPELYQVQGYTQVYRNSLLRRLRNLEPGFLLNEEVGIISLDSYINELLTGFVSGGVLPTGFPPKMKYQPHIFWKAQGYEPSLSSATYRPTSPHPLLPSIQSQIHGSPYVYARSTTLGAALYGIASDPLGWGVILDWQLTFGWYAPPSPSETITLSIREPSEATKNLDEAPPLQNNPKKSEENTRSTWSEYFSSILQENLRIFDSTQSSLQTYQYQTHPLTSASWKGLCGWENRTWTEADIRQAPLGSAGLRVLPMETGYQIIGISEGHSQEHFRRAFLEGLCFELRRFRIKCGLYKKNPIKLILGLPWSPDLCQLVCDILGETLIYVPRALEEVAAQGLALGLGRDKAWFEENAKVNVSSYVIEPSARSAEYEPFYRIHEALCSLF